MTLTPDRNTNQNNSADRQRDDDRKFDHGNISSLKTTGSVSIPGPTNPAGAVPTMSPAGFSADPGPCGFIDFDNEREFDFSLIPARPALRLVISNSSPVKA